MAESINYQSFEEKILTRKLKNSSEILSVEFRKQLGYIGKIKATIYNLIGNARAKTLKTEKASTDVRLGVANGIISAGNLFLFK